MISDLELENKLLKLHLAYSKAFIELQNAQRLVDDDILDSAKNALKSAFELEKIKLLCYEKEKIIFFKHLDANTYGEALLLSRKAGYNLTFKIEDNCHVTTVIEPYYFKEKTKQNAKSNQQNKPTKPNSENQNQSYQGTPI